MPHRRLVYHSSSPLVDFLSLLFQFTFLQKSPEAILACLEVWAAVCDYLEGSKEAGKGKVIGRYTEALAALVSELLRRLHAVLANLDHERIGEDGTTEWQAFLNACLELVMRIAELLPEQTPATVEVVWRDTSAAYLGLENQVEGSNGERRLNSECEYVQSEAHHCQVHHHDEEGGQSSIVTVHVYQQGCTGQGEHAGAQADGLEVVVFI